jgi:hypothetical protein
MVTDDTFDRKCCAFEGAWRNVKIIYRLTGCADRSPLPGVLVISALGALAVLLVRDGTGATWRPRVALALSLRDVLVRVQHSKRFWLTVTLFFVVFGAPFVGSAMMWKWWSVHWMDLDARDPKVQERVETTEWADVLLISFPCEFLPLPADDAPEFQSYDPGVASKPIGLIDAIEAIPWGRQFIIQRWVLNAFF